MDQSIPIVCPYCGVGCNLELALDENGVPTKGKASGRNQELNQKYLCAKGMVIPEMITHEDRLRYPEIRKEGKLQRASWEEAFDESAKRLKAVISEYGPESVGMLASSKVLNEEVYLCQKFHRQAIGNNNIDNCARLCHGPSEAGLRQQLGYGAVSVFFEDYDEVETVFLVGANTAFTHPIIWQRIRKNLKDREINLVLADPRKTDLSKNASVYLPAKPGTDIYWMKALARIILNNNGHDEEFCRTRTLGLQALKKNLEEVDIEAACAVAGVTPQALGKVAELICGKKTIFIWGMGLTQHAHGTNNVHSLVNLALLTGNVGKPGCGVAPLRGQNNVQGACDLGALPNMLPGHIPVDDEASRIHVEGIWGCRISSKPGLAAPEMFHEIANGKIRALYVVGENPAVSEPQSTFVSWMLQRLDLLIVQDIFPSETYQYADIVFPAASVGETAGTYMNAARRVQYTADGITPPGEAKADWQILQEMAAAMDVKWDYKSTEDIWDEIRLVAPAFAGITHKRLIDSPGLFWPCYDEAHPGTPRLYQDGFIFRDRRARFIPVESPRNLMLPTATYPFVLITGRLLEHFNTGEMSRRSTKLMRMTGEGYVEMNHADAEKAGVAEGDAVRVTSPFGSVKVPLKVSEKLASGYLFAPIHFVQPNCNALMSAVPMDPKARMPALKVVPAALEKTG